MEKAALNVKGPKHIDFDGWKQILCSKAYGKLPFQFCGAVAELATGKASLHRGGRPRMPQRVCGVKSLYEGSYFTA